MDVWFRATQAEQMKGDLEVNNLLNYSHKRATAKQIKEDTTVYL